MTDTVQVPNVHPHARSGIDHQELSAAGNVTAVAASPETAETAVDPDAYDRIYGAGEQEQPVDAEPVDYDVPDGSVPDVLAWVSEGAGDEAKARAAAALAVEEAKPVPRTTLVEPLHAVING